MLLAAATGPTTNAETGDPAGMGLKLLGVCDATHGEGVTDFTI